MDQYVQSLSVGRRCFDDPFFEEGDKACGLFKRMCVFDIDDEELCHNVSKEFSCEVPGCTCTFETLLEFEVHYNTLHRYNCSVCHKILPSPHFLDLHIEENHDSFFILQAERKPMYQCLVEDCKTKFKTPGERKDHCLKTHLFPPNFRWFVPTGNSKKGKSKSCRKKPKKNVDAEMADDIPDSTLEDVMGDCSGGTTSQQSPKKKPRKKKTIKTNSMELDSENSVSMDTENKTPLDSSDKTKKSPAPFKGFIPRNVNANRAFHQKAYYKGRDWHQKESSLNVQTSSLESSNLSVDLRDSLPTNMEEA